MPATNENTPEHGRADRAPSTPAGAGRVADGPLDGRTILRFAHAYESGGGTERYLDDLDRTLLARNAMTVLRVHIASDPARLGEQTERIGRGLLVRIPLPLASGEGRQVKPEVEPSGVPWKALVRNWLLYNPLVWRLVTRRRLPKWRVPRRPGDVAGAGRKVAELMRRHRVDLIVLHFFGGADADEIVGEALRAGVPYVVLNHYSNDRFLHLSMRKHALLAAGVAGVNGLGLPRYVRGRFCNLSDGIDVDFFQRRNAVRPTGAPDKPLILLPARIVRAKGHLDLVQAAVLMRRQGLAFAIGFAGRADSSDFNTELRDRIKEAGLGDVVHFLGELSVPALRDWYGASAVLALPTYHHEGLPRVILEAEAMKVPVVAYGSGGVPEGIRSGQTGYVLSQGDVAGLARKLGELVADAHKRSQMGDVGRRWVEQHFSLESLADRHERFYLQAVSASGVVHLSHEVA